MTPSKFWTRLFVALLVVNLTGVFLSGLSGHMGYFSIDAGASLFCLYAIATENRWPQRLHISHLRWRARHLEYVMDKTVDEMLCEWHEAPGSDHWHALDAWLSELHMERRALRLRIEDLTYKLGRETY